MIRIVAVFGLASLIGFAVTPGESVAQIATNAAQKSPWGASDEIGTLNMMTDDSRFDVLKQITGGKVYDLGRDLFPGMPICCGAFGDPARAVLIDVAKSKGVDRLPDSYSITVGDLQDALKKQGTTLRGRRCRSRALDLRPTGMIR